MTHGYDKPLYFLPFDHRGSFKTGMFGWKGVLTPEQTAQIAATKQVIYDGFKSAVASGVDKEKAGILVDEQFGEMLKRFQLPENWREIIRRNMVAQALTAGVTPETVEREKERLKLKKSRTVKLYKEGYIDDEEFQGEMAAVELALKQLDAPEVDGITYDEVIEAGEHLPGMAALWDVATVEERYEMVTIILEPGGLYYDLENKIIAAIKPRPAFLPVLRMLNGVMEFDETRGLLVTEHWCERNRRESDYPQGKDLVMCQFLPREYLGLQKAYLLAA